MREQSDMLIVTMIVKSDSNLPDSKSDLLPITFCFLESPYTHLACQDAAGSRVKWQEHRLWSQKGRFESQLHYLPALWPCMNHSVFLCFLFLISEVGINCAYTS